ncbi:MAG: hypothetical protein MJA27_18540 [Pseudanabaenales cyanobacterium]|nr:hypothetical protein [Pseudanabaenales cyanobacterium]
MMTPLNPDHPPNGCEITFPIVLKFRIYLEPEVVETPSACHRQKLAPRPKRVNDRWSNLLSAIALRLSLFTLALAGVLILH